MYTDDSDPLAAAIHSGWVAGDYGDDINPEMLDPHPASPTPIHPTPKAEDDSINNIPTRPLHPPRGKDLHLTILILPPLARYQGSIRHGIKSRDWGDDHTGPSFLVQALRWLDEGGSRGRERGAQARHAYLHSRSMLPAGRLVRAEGPSGLWKAKKGKGKARETAKGKAKEEHSIEGERDGNAGTVEEEEEGPKAVVAAAAAAA